MLALIDHPHARVKLRSERLLVFARRAGAGDGEGDAAEREFLRAIPLFNLDRLVINETVQLTSQALAALLRRRIPLSLLDWHGHYLGGFHPAAGAESEARLQQYRVTENPSLTLGLARRTVRAKLYNGRSFLQRLSAHREDSDFAPEIDRLAARLENAETAADVDALRGCEGAGSASFFAAWARCLPPEFPFEHRSARPPHNPVNACISYLATLLYHELVSQLHAHGLDPGLGLLHRTENGRWSLALDLLEPFRPCFVEALTLHLFSHRILNHDHFEKKHGGVYLNEAGRPLFFAQYEQRMQREFFCLHTNCRTTLRRQLDQQVLTYKAALTEPDKFAPFRMN